MSKIYIYATKNPDEKLKKVVLELSSSNEAKSAYQTIKQLVPRVSINVFGARDITSFRRTQRSLKNSQVVHSVSDFIRTIDSSKIETIH